MKYIYTGVFFELDDLINKFNNNIHAARLSNTIQNPHVTFTYKPTQVNEDLFGTPTKFEVIGYACDGKNQGFKVRAATIHKSLRDEYENIENPHITISVSEDGKPVDTGKLDFHFVEKPFFITGHYGAFSNEGVITRKPTLTVREFCKTKTNATELCVIRDGGWCVGYAWIDYEDIFRLPESLTRQPVKSNEWGTLPIVDKDGNKIEIPVHYIDT